MRENTTPEKSGLTELRMEGLKRNVDLAVEDIGKRLKLNMDVFEEVVENECKYGLFTLHPTAAEIRSYDSSGIVARSDSARSRSKCYLQEINIVVCMEKSVVLLI